MLGEGVGGGRTDGRHAPARQGGPGEPAGRKTPVDHRHAVDRREHDPCELLERVQRLVEGLPRRRRRDDDRRGLQHTRAGGLEELGEALGLRGGARHHDGAALQRSVVVRLHARHQDRAPVLGLRLVMSAAR